MADVVIQEPEEAPEPEAESAHAAAVAEGAAEAHGERAAEAAVEAELAASESREVAAGVGASAIDAMDAAGRAEEAANSANAAALAVAESLQGFTTAVVSFQESMAASQKTQPDPEKSEAKAPDRPPATKKRRLGDRYYGKR